MRICKNSDGEETWGGAMQEQHGEEQLYEEAGTEARRHLTDAVIRNPIRRLQWNAPLSVPLGSSVAYAIQGMIAGRVGCCLITRFDGLVAGIVSERDILTKVAGRGRDPAQVKVDEVMTPNPEGLSPDDPIGFALNRMALGGYRHVPIVDAKKKPVGILSVRIILRYLADYFPEDVMNLPPSPEAAIGRDREGA